MTGASTVAVSGPLILSLPLVGGGGILDGSVLVLTDDAGNDVIFEFNLTNTAATVPGSIPVGYNSFDTVDVIANSLGDRHQHGGDRDYGPSPRWWTR